MGLTLVNRLPVTDLGPLYDHFNNFGRGDVFGACTKDLDPYNRSVVGRSCLVFYRSATGHRWSAMVGNSLTIVFSGLHKVFSGL